MSIRKFFTPMSAGSTTPTSTPQKQKADLFKPFVLKRGMKLAPMTRCQKFSKEETEKFDLCVGISGLESYTGNLYLEELRGGIRRPKSSQRTNCVEPDVIIVNNETQNVSGAVRGPKLRLKLLQFHENRRPSKYGCLLSVSRKISGRRPFAKDETVFNYEVDSDDEWEDEGEGDDCESGDADDESDDLEADDEDKTFFVDHGYLSPSENGSDVEDADPAARRERGKAKLLTFEAEMESRKLKRLRLIQYGPYWPIGNSDIDDPNWSLKLSGFKTLTISVAKPIPTSFTPNVQMLATPLRTKTPRSEKKASVKRKIQERVGDAGGVKGSKRAALSLP